MLAQAAAVQVPSGLRVGAELLPGQPKALPVQILSKRFLPRELPKKWHQTLESELDRASMNAIRSAWREISVGDPG